MGQAGGEYRGGEPGQHEGEGADVIFVAVGDEDAADAVGAVGQVGNVGDDEVNAGQSLLGELDAAIDDYDVVLVFEG